MRGTEIAIYSLNRPTLLKHLSSFRRSPESRGHRPHSPQARRGDFRGQARPRAAWAGEDTPPPFPGGWAAVPSGGKRSPAFPSPEERKTPASAAPPRHSPHQLGAVLHLSSGRRAAPARCRPPAAKPRQPAPQRAAAEQLPQPGPRHGGGRHAARRAARAPPRPPVSPAPRGRAAGSVWRRHGR